MKMGVEKMQQNLFTGLFKTITKEEWEEILQREVENFCNESGNQSDSILPNSVEKHLIGCPRKFAPTLQFERQIKKKANEEEDVDNQEENKPKRQKSGGQYTNWFQPHLLPPIMAIVQKYGTNFDVVHYLWTTYQSPGVPSPYEKLARNSLWTWFTPKGELRPNYLYAFKQGTTMRYLKQHLLILEEYPTLWDELVTMLQKMRSVGELFTSMV
jgi:hypothetical protein